MLPAFTQLLLNQGDTYSYEWTSLPFGGTIETMLLTAPPPSEVDIYRGSLTGDLKVELFEGSLQGPLLFSQPIQNPQFLLIYSPFSWGAGGGAVKFTMLSGTTIIPFFDIQSSTRIAGNYYDIYSTRVEPVPEPATLVMMIFVALSFYTLQNWKKHFGLFKIVP